jgi:hypothetical protein
MLDAAATQLERLMFSTMNRVRRQPAVHAALARLDEQAQAKHLAELVLRELRTDEQFIALLMGKAAEETR